MDIPRDFSLRVEMTSEEKIYDNFLRTEYGLMIREMTEVEMVAFLSPAEWKEDRLPETVSRMVIEGNLPEQDELTHYVTAWVAPLEIRIPVTEEMYQQALQRMQKAIAVLEKEQQRLSKKLDNPRFIPMLLQKWWHQIVRNSKKRLIACHSCNKNLNGYNNAMKNFWLVIILPVIIVCLVFAILGLADWYQHQYEYHYLPVEKGVLYRSGTPMSEAGLSIFTS